MQGCEQTFTNLVITSHGRISECCGLTFEHIPEMKLGNIGGNNALIKAYDEQLKDFLKVWIKVDGPTSIIEQLMGKLYRKLHRNSFSQLSVLCIFTQRA